MVIKDVSKMKSIEDRVDNNKERHLIDTHDGDYTQGLLYDLVVSAKDALDTKDYQKFIGHEAEFRDEFNLYQNKVNNLRGEIPKGVTEEQHDHIQEMDKFMQTVNELLKVYSSPGLEPKFDEFYEKAVKHFDDIRNTYDKDLKTTYKK